MASEEPSQNPTNPEDQSQNEEDSGKKLSKKEAAKLERLRKRQEAAAAAAATNISSMAIDAADPLAENYGETRLDDLKSKEISGRKWTEVKELNEGLKDQDVLIRGRCQAIRAVGKKMAFVVVRERGFTVQCVLTVTPDVVSAQMVKFATSLRG